VSGYGYGGSYGGSQPVPPPTDGGCPVFGSSVGGHDLEGWAIDLCREWISTFMSELERRNGLTERTLSRPRSYVVAPSFDAFAEEQLPRLLFISPGIAQAPVKRGDGTYDAYWLLGVGAHYSASTEEDARFGARLLTQAVRDLLVDRPSLGGHCAAADWLDERYDDLPYEDQRSHASGQVHFQFLVQGAAQAGTGPLASDQPSDEPWPDWPQVIGVEIDTQRTPADTSPAPVRIRPRRRVRHEARR